MPQAPGFEDWDPAGADKNYDTAGFVASCRANRVTPHVAQNDGRGSGSAISGRTTRWAGYAISQRKRKCIKQVFGWSKTVGRIRQVMYRGRERVEQLFLLTQAAYNPAIREAASVQNVNNRNGQSPSSISRNSNATVSCSR